jgi:hypothetical protein
LRKCRIARAYGCSNTTPGIICPYLFIGEFLYGDQEQNLLLFLAKCDKRSPEISIFEGSVLSALAVRRFFFGDLRQRVA